MNVYVDSLARALGEAGVTVDVLARADDRNSGIVEVTDSYRVVHLDVGPRRSLHRGAWTSLIDPYTEAARSFIRANGDYDVLHAHYWLSGAIAHRLKHELDRPLVSTFHTLALVKSAAGFSDDDTRAQIERDVVRCSDLMLANTRDEAEQLIGLYEADATRVEIVPPGVDHVAFSPVGDRNIDRAALGVEGHKVVLFAGRIQPLKGADVAIRLVAALKDPHVLLLLVGGPSGIDGERELRRLHALVDETGLADQVRFVGPQEHNALARYYRAADVCVVPSRTESFGLVALEAQSCGTPVVASAVGGLRLAVDDHRSGVLVGCCDANNFVEPVRRILDDAAYREELARGAVAHAATFSWAIAAARLRRHYSDLTAREPVRCA